MIFQCHGIFDYGVDARFATRILALRWRQPIVQALLACLAASPLVNDV
jgi:hypothetical protein